MNSNNMHYRYNVEYYDNLNIKIKKEDGKEKVEFEIDEPNTKKSFEDKNKKPTVMDIRSKKIFGDKNFVFVDNNVFNLPDKEAGIKSFELWSSYPGVMIGIGNPHSIKIEGALQNGFTFDYVTGLPFLPGSSLKGILRSIFPGKKLSKGKEQYIRDYLKGDQKQINIHDFGDFIFGSDEKMQPGKGVFYGVFPEPKGKIFTDDYITPHSDDFTNPVPVRMLKIRPDVKFVFKFSCDTYEEDKIKVTSDDMVDLFKNIIMDIGIGAKTNVGYGMMVEKNKIFKNISLKANNGVSSGNNNQQRRSNNSNEHQKNFDSKKRKH